MRLLVLAAILLAGSAGCGSSGSGVIGSDSGRTPVTLTEPQDQAVRQAVVARLDELGRSVAAKDLRLEGLAVEGIPGLAAYRAVYGDGDSIAVLQGTVDGAGAVNSMPNDALVQIWNRWLADAGALPDPVVVTETSLFLLGGVDHRVVALTEGDLDKVTTNPAHRAKVRLPRALDDGRVGVVFWMARQNDLSEITLVLDDIMIDMLERPVDQVA